MEKEYNLICLDIEATGFREREDVIQFAMVSRNGDKIFDLYTRPTHFTDDELKWSLRQKGSVHNIGYKQLRDKLPLRSYKKQIQKVIDRARIIVGFSIKNDIHWLNKNGIIIPKGKRIIDIQQIFRIYRYVQSKKPNENVWKTLNSLKTCAKHCEYIKKENESYRFHSALGDSDATMHCYRYLSKLKLSLDVGLVDEKGEPLMNKEKIITRFNKLQKKSADLRKFFLS